MTTTPRNPSLHLAACRGESPTSCMARDSGGFRAWQKRSVKSPLVQRDETLRKSRLVRVPQEKPPSSGMGRAGLAAGQAKSNVLIAMAPSRGPGVGQRSAIPPPSMTIKGGWRAGRRAAHWPKGIYRLRRSRQPRNSHGLRWFASSLGYSLQLSDPVAVP